jgi:hypothetical protein
MQGTPRGTSISDLRPTAERSAAVPSSRETAPGPVELAAWLEERGDRLVEHWIHELQARELGHGTGADRVVELFARQLVGLLPEMIGPYRAQLEPLWDRAAELYGAMAAKRGLASGEAIDELHVFRELVIRELYRHPPGDCSVPLMLREFLRLNRSLDRAVTHVSVGHTDALFFQFFEGDGVGAPVLSGDEVVGEAEKQLSAIRDEAEHILRQAPWNGNGVGSGRPGVRGN